MTTSEGGGAPSTVGFCPVVEVGDGGPTDILFALV
jgi:hypothetical protein